MAAINVLSITETTSNCPDIPLTGVQAPVNPVREDRPVAAFRELEPGEIPPRGYGQLFTCLLPVWNVMRPAEHHIYGVLCMHAWQAKAFKVTFTNKRLAELSGLPVRTVQAGIRGLTKRVACIRVVARQYGSGATYQLLIPDEEKGRSAVANRAGEAESTARSRRAQSAAPSKPATRSPLRKVAQRDAPSGAVPRAFQPGIQNSAFTDEDRTAAETGVAAASAAQEGGKEAPPAAPTPSPTATAARPPSSPQDEPSFSPQARLLMAAGVPQEMACLLPLRPEVYTLGLISRLRSGAIQIGGVIAGMREGDWDVPGLQPADEAVWDIDPAFRRVWTTMTEDRRSAGLQKALAKFVAEGQRQHIQAVVAGTAKPREWLISEVYEGIRSTEGVP